MKVILLALVAVSIFGMSYAQYKESYYDRGNNYQNSYATNGDEEENDQHNNTENGSAQNGTLNNGQGNGNNGKGSCPYCSKKAQDNQNQNRVQQPDVDLTTPAKIYGVDRG